MLIILLTFLSFFFLSQTIRMYFLKKRTTFLLPSSNIYHTRQSQDPFSLSSIVLHVHTFPNEACLACVPTYRAGDNGYCFPIYLINVRTPSPNLSDRFFPLYYFTLKILPFERRVSIKRRACTYKRSQFGNSGDRDIDIRGDGSPGGPFHEGWPPSLAASGGNERQKDPRGCLVNLSAETARVVVSRTAR